MKISEELQQRKAQLLEREWVQGNPVYANQSCLIFDGTGQGFDCLLRRWKVTSGLSHVAKNFLCWHYLKMPPSSWNDMPGRTLGQVLDMLDEAAIAAKEMEIDDNQNS